MATPRVDVWAGAPARPSYTREHRPLVWENMLGTVYGLRHGDEEATYFDYDYAACHAHVGLEGYEDLRVCRVKYTYAGWPRAGKWALFGVRIRPQAELRKELEGCERAVAQHPRAGYEVHRRSALRALQARQLRDFAR